jgi:hypothetical protein
MLIPACPRCLLRNSLSFSWGERCRPRRASLSAAELPQGYRCRILASVRIVQRLAAQLLADDLLTALRPTVMKS